MNASWVDMVACIRSIHPAPGSVGEERYARKVRIVYTHTLLQFTYLLCRTCNSEVVGPVRKFIKKKTC